MEDNSSRKQEKVLFYERLEAVDKVDDSEDEGMLEAENFLRQAKPPTKRAAKQGTSQTSGHIGQIDNLNTLASKPCHKTTPMVTAENEIPSLLRRVNSLPDPKDKRRKLKSTGPPRLLSTKSAPPAVETMTRGKVITKRQKTCHKPEVPDNMKIFKELKFFFLPNNKINAFRAARIEKVQQYGGTWTESWVDQMDFVILDDILSYQDLLKCLKVEHLPELVRVTYTKFVSDSVDYKVLMDSSQPCYQVRGAPKRAKTSEVEQPEIPSSLPLKAVKKAQDVRTPSPDTLDVVADATEQPPSSHNDDLTKIIDEHKKIEHLPLDDDAEVELVADAQAVSSDSSASKHAYKHQRRLNWQKGFSCMRKNEKKGAATGPNAATIEILEQLGRYYDRMRDEWRVIAYRKAITILKKQSHRIMSKEQAYALPGIGTRLALKIEEISLTNRLQRLDNALEDPNDAILQRFTQIYGVGLQLASKWIKAGYKTFEDLHDNVALTPSQRIGIKHYDDFLRRIPRAEVAQHGAYVQAVLKEIDASYEMRVMGSYIRGAESSGDIDIVVTKRDANKHTISNVVFNALIPALTKKGFLRTALATAHVGDDGDKWHGCSCLPGMQVWRRMDFLVVPWDEMGAAMIYFTGNDLFNRSIRLLASKKGMRLNQRGLFKHVMRGTNKDKVTDGEVVESRSEKKIFEILGVPWRRPEERNA